MTTKHTPTNHTDLYPGFDVTCVIGHVDVAFDGHGPHPHEAAFQLIAGHGAEGTFTFPMEDGRIARVTVEYREWNEG